MRYLRAIVPWLLAAGIAGCHEHVAVTANTAPRPDDRGPLVRRLETDVDTLNPVCAHEQSAWLVRQYLFTPLIYLDAQMHAVPALAVSWSVSSDRRVYQFVLNRDATFSDGSPVRAQDVVFTLTRIHNPAMDAHSASEFQYLDLAHTRAVNDTTVEVAFDRALAAQFSFFADVFVVPEHVYAHGDFRADYYRRAVGSGPYVLDHHDAERIYLQRRENYWREKPHIRTVIFRILGDYETAWKALKRGDIDESYIPSRDWVQEHTNEELQRRLEFRRFYMPEYSCVVWNLRHPILRDKRVRRALAMSVPLEPMIQSLYSGTARTLTGPFTLDHDGYNRSVAAIPYDPIAARALLAEAGWHDRGDGVLAKDGNPFHLDLLLLTPSARPFAESLQDSLIKVGVQIAITVMDAAAATAYIRAGNYDATYMQWTFDPREDLYPIFHSSQMPPHGGNVAYYANAEVDRLLEQARVETDTDRRRAMNMRVHALIADDQPCSFFFQNASAWGTSKRLKGVQAAPLRGLFLWYPGELGWRISRGRGN